MSRMPTFTMRGRTYKAWSKMKCGDKKLHAPHVWNSAAMCYGPYFCEGVVEGKCPCVSDCGHPIDYHSMHPHESGMVLICTQCHINQRDQLAAVTADNKRLRVVLENADTVSISQGSAVKGTRLEIHKDQKGWWARKWFSGTTGAGVVSFDTLDEALAFVRGEGGV